MKIFALNNDIIYSPRMITADPTDVMLLRDKLAELRWRRNVENPRSVDRPWRCTAHTGVSLGMCAAVRLFT